ncbi:MAG: GNAT family N-acetyltransferase [Rhizobiales bacterium]|nr:GNAT family N-acetyltransferase [Hyphomicrobiales bacterium]
MNDSVSATEQTTANADTDASSIPVVNKNSLTLHQATRAEDIVKLRDIMLEFHSECRYSHLPFSEEKFIRIYTKAINNLNDTIFLYIQRDGKTVGALNAGVGDYYLGVGGRMVTVYGIYVSKRIRGSFLGGKVGLKLIRAISDWAKSKDAEEIHIHTTSGIETMRTDKLLTRIGFSAMGANYVAKI